jgi:hypothetical protein
MELNSKTDRRHNAIKHGAFAKALVILNENKDDFDELHQSCVKELKPSGLMEEELVLTIAKYMWRKRRIERLFSDEANWLQEHPAAPELRTVSQFNEIFIQKGSPCSHVWNLVALLPEDYRAAIRKKFKCPSTDYDDEWIDQVKKFISHLHAAAEAGALSYLEDPRSVGETAAKIRELTAKQTALEDRLDKMIGKALKRLATLKTFKQVVAIQETSQPRKISAS